MKANQSQVLNDSVIQNLADIAAVAQGMKESAAKTVGNVVQVLISNDPGNARAAQIEAPTEAQSMTKKKGTKESRTVRVSDFMRAILSKSGPPKPMTRLVLIALSQWADWDTGLNCFPSIQKIVNGTRLSERAVRTHLQEAEDAGWIERTSQGGGQGWRRYEYTLLIPEGAAPDTAPLPERAAPRSKTCGTSFQNVRHEVPITNTNDPPIPTQEKTPTKHGQEKPSRFEEFWKAYPPGRKTKKADSLKVWNKQKLDKLATKIIDDVTKRPTADPQWIKDEGQYIPGPLPYLRGKRWQDEWAPVAKTNRLAI